MKKRLVDLAVAGVVLALVQAVVETLALAILHRELLLAPVRFFPTQAWDAFAKLWFAAGTLVPLPPLLQDFVGQGMAAKLVLLPQLAGIGVASAIVLALLLAPLAGRLGLDRRPGTVTALGILVVVSLMVHAVAWWQGFQAPEVVTAFKLLRSVLRDLVQGGVAQALAVLLASALGARVLLGREGRGAAAAVLGGLLLVLGVVAGRLAEAGPTERAARPVAPSPAAGWNVVLVSIDSLRADHLGSYGYSRPTSPAMDRMATEGVRFAHHASVTSWTLPAHMSLLTARSLLGHGVVSDDRSLPDSVPTLAEAFQSGGYETHAIVSAPYLNSRYGFAKGFADYDDHTVHFETNEDSYRSVTGPKVVDAASAFLQDRSGKPFFLFLHFWDVHYDYAPEPPYDRMFDRDYAGKVDGNNFYFDPSIRAGMDPRDLQHLLALYDGEIRSVDDQLARLRAELERLGIADRTILAITADHGDEFFEHGNKGHHRTLYGEVLDTPFVLEVPGRSPSKSVVDQESSIIDIGPTLLGLAGVAAPEGAEGRDFSGLYTGAPLPEPGPVHAELYRTGTRNVQAAVIDSRHKLIHHFQRRSAEVYDLAADAAEQKPLAPSGSVGAPLAASLRAWIDGRWQRFDRRLRTEGVRPVVLDAKDKEQLRSLGYLQ